MRYLWQRIVVMFCVVHSIFGISSALSQSFPSKAVRIVYPGPPGSTGDIISRAIAQKLTELWRQPVVVDNRSGAAGIIGSMLVAKAAPDGYTLLLGHAGAQVLNVILRPKLPYKTLRDFVPVTMVATGPNVLIVHPSLPVKSVKNLIQLAKSRPDQLNFGSGGAGLSPHLAAELFKNMANIRMVHVPYQGLPPALTALVSGEVSVLFPTIPTAMHHIQSGKVRALGVTSARRFFLLPDLPTVAESGLENYEVTAWFGVFAPAGLSNDIVKKLNLDIQSVLRTADVNTFIAKLGIEVVSNTPAEFHSQIMMELVKWEKVIRDAGIDPIE